MSTGRRFDPAARLTVCHWPSHGTKDHKPAAPPVILPVGLFTIVPLSVSGTSRQDDGSSSDLIQLLKSDKERSYDLKQQFIFCRCRNYIVS
jgi:hypothetical protein